MTVSQISKLTKKTIAITIAGIVVIVIGYLLALALFFWALYAAVNLVEPPKAESSPRRPVSSTWHEPSKLNFTHSFYQIDSYNPQETR